MNPSVHSYERCEKIAEVVDRNFFDMLKKVAHLNFSVVFNDTHGLKYDSP